MKKLLTYLYLKPEVFALGLLVALVTIVALVPDLSFAGTGGSEVQTWYQSISDALKGFWGKLIALAFIGFSLVAFKQGAIVPAIFLIFIGLGVGVIPDIVDAKFTLLF